jgi:hypothetical protein
MSISRSLNRLFDKGRDERREPPVPTNIVDNTKPAYAPDLFATAPLLATAPPKPTPLTKDQTQALLKKPITPAAAPLPEPKTEAQKILRQEGIAKPSDILGQTFFEKPEDILRGEGITKAEDILKGEKEKEASKEFAKTKQMEMLREEMDFQKQQQQYINNIDPNNFKFPNQNTYDTKFGSIDFDKAEVKGGYYGGYHTTVDFKIPTGVFFEGTKYEQTKYDDYTFIPADYITKGVRKMAGSPAMFFNEAFLRQDHWEKFLDKTQMIDISDFSGEANKFLKDRYDTNTSSVGFLMKTSDMLELLPANDFKSRPLNDQMHGGEIQGLAYHPDLKKLVYVTEPKGRAQVSYMVYDDAKGTSVSWGHWQTRKKTFLGKILGNTITDIATDIAQTFADIPFAPEIAALATGNPQLYASLKALQVAGKGGTLEDVVKAGVTAYAVQSIPLKNISAQVTDTLYKGGQGVIANEVVAKAVGGALTYSTFNGIMAAVQGQDISEAMKVGAIGGGIGAVGPEFTNKVFGGAENVIKLSDQLNINPRNFQKVFTNATISGAVAAAQGKDFTKQFTNTLIAEGVGTVAASNVVKAMGNSGLSKEALNEIGNNVYTMVSASARAAVRGESIEQALQATARRAIGRSVGFGLKAKLSDVAKYREQEEAKT